LGLLDSNSAVTATSQEQLPDLLKDVVLCINAANDAGATIRNPEPPNQPISFHYVPSSKKM